MTAPMDTPKDYVILELNHIALDVSDVEASRLFYRDVLGLLELPRPAFPFPWAWFRLGSLQELHLIGERERTGSVRSGHFALLVNDLDAVASRLCAAGVGFRGPKPRPDGAGQLFTADPDGNVIEFTSGLPGRSI